MATQNKLVVYINGVRFSPLHVGVSATRNGVVGFSITVPAVREWTVLPPRSHAAVFFVDPVTQSWRMMCEGEYIGFSRAFSGDGSRARTLTFRGLHGCWQNISYLNIVGMSQNNTQANNTQIAVANGQALYPDTGKTAIPIASLDAIVEETFSKTSQVADVLSNICNRVVQQTPLEAFYRVTRQWSQKFHTPPDLDISNLMDNQRTRALIKGGLNSFKLGENVKLSDIIRGYASLPLYQMVPVLAPRVHAPQDADTVQGRVASWRIPELLFVPEMFFTVPPACNVIFRDQIVSQDMSVNFDAVPTRAIAEVQVTELTGDAKKGIPPFYMSNGSYVDNVTDRQTDAGRAPVAALTHYNFSEEELMRGVVSRKTNLSYDRVAIEQDSAIPQEVRPEALQAMFSELTRHDYLNMRGRALTQQVTCCFLPYVQPGFNALVEDPTGPFFGIIESVSHMMSASGQVQTNVTFTHVRDAYTVGVDNRTPYHPKYFNRAFRARGISDQYTKMFGNNLHKHAAMVPNEVLTQYAVEDGAGGSLTRVNLDALAGQVIQIPRYSPGFRSSGDLTDGRIAANLRANPVLTHQRMQEYQYRSGTSLEDFVAFHGLWPNASGKYDTNLESPPLDLAPQRPGEGGAPLFSSPYGMDYRDGNELDPDWGIYEPREGRGGKYSPARQEVTRMIAAKIAEGAST